MKKHTLAVAACFVLWGLLPAFWKLFSGVDAFYTLATRIVWSLAVSAAAIFAAKEWPQLKAAFRDKKTFWLLAAASVFITVNWGCYIWGVMNGMVLDCSLAYYINPILSIVIGAAMYRERINKLQWVSVALAVCAVAYPIISAGKLPVLALLMSTCFALYGAIKKKVTVSSNISIAVETLIVTPFALALIIVMEARGAGAVASGAMTGWRLILLPLAGILTYIPLALFSYGVQETSMSLSGILMYVNPTLQLILGVTLFGEELTREKIVTFVLVWAAVIVFVMAGRVRQRSVSARAEGVKTI